MGRWGGQDAPPAPDEPVIDIPEDQRNPLLSAAFSQTGLVMLRKEYDAEIYPSCQELLNRLDEQYTRTPFYGVRRMTAWLRQEGYGVNEKLVRRLLRLRIDRPIEIEPAKLEGAINSAVAEMFAKYPTRRKK